MESNTAELEPIIPFSKNSMKKSQVFHSPTGFTQLPGVRAQSFFFSSLPRKIVSTRHLNDTMKAFEEELIIEFSKIKQSYVICK